MTTRKYLTSQQIVDAAGLFNQYLTKDGCPEGTCRYTNGSSDHSVAEALSAKADAISRLRLQLWGKLVFQTRPALEKAVPHEGFLQLSKLVSELAMTVKYLADKLGEDVVARNCHKIAQDATKVEE